MTKMKKRHHPCQRCAAMLVLPLFTVIFAITIPSLAAAQNSKEAETVLGVERKACLAYQNGDVEAIRNYLTDDYILTNSKGEMTTKQDDLDDAATGKAKYTLFENRDMKVRLYAGNNAAVVIGKTFLKGTYDNKPIDIEVQFTDTLVKQDGHWRLAAGHVSRLHE